MNANIEPDWSQLNDSLWGQSQGHPPQPPQGPLKLGASLLLAAFALFLLIFLSGCSTTPGVHVIRATSPSVSPDAGFLVEGRDPDSVWAAQQALLGQAGSRGSSPAASTGLVLQVYTMVNTEVRSRPDPFCDPMLMGWGPYGYGWRGYRSPFGYYGCSSVGSLEAFPVRTVSWVLIDRQGRLLWYATARDSRPNGPPVVVSDKLAKALNAWRSPSAAGQ